MRPQTPPHPEFGKRIRKRREELGLRQIDIADHVGVSITSVRHWERGRTSIADERIPLLVDILDCEPTDLWPGWKPQPKRGGSSSSSLRDMQDQIDELKATVDRMQEVIAARPQDPDALRREAQQLAGQDASDAPPKRRGRKR